MLDTEKVDPKGLPVQVATVRIYLHCARFLPRAGGGPEVQSVGGSRSTKAITAKAVGLQPEDSLMKLAGGPLPPPAMLSASLQTPHRGDPPAGGSFSADRIVHQDVRPAGSPKRLPRRVGKLRAAPRTSAEPPPRPFRPSRSEKRRRVTKERKT